ncbi:MAG: PilZ domain-containing protein [candidate division Zixibacteria bacterium]|nr:PilZ domain-containing protein [candidate division Zixibacteria bacterium]
MAQDIVVVKGAEIDFSGLVGREIMLRTDQFPGKSLSTRVMAIRDNSLVIDRSGSGGLIDQLIHNQPLEVYFQLKGQPARFMSVLACPREGRLQIPIGQEIYPEGRRKFERVDVVSDVQLTLFDEQSIGAVRLNRLKWLETKTINVSGGGMLVTLPLQVVSDHYLILHLQLEDVELPKLMVGRTRHVTITEKYQSLVGVEFIVREDRFAKVPKSIIRHLPVKLFDFCTDSRDELDRYLIQVNK